MQPLIARHSLKKRLLGHQPQLAGQGSGHSLADDATQQPHVPHHVAGVESLQRERLVALIEAQQPQLTLSHQGDAGRKRGVVIQLLARSQLQGLKRISKLGLHGLRQLRERCPRSQYP